MEVDHEERKAAVEDNVLFEPAIYVPGAEDDAEEAMGIDDTQSMKT